MVSTEGLTDGYGYSNLSLLFHTTEKTMNDKPILVEVRYSSRNFLRRTSETELVAHRGGTVDGFAQELRNAYAKLYPEPRYQVSISVSDPKESSLRRVLLLNCGGITVEHKISLRVNDLIG